MVGGHWMVVVRSKMFKKRLLVDNIQFSYGSNIGSCIFSYHFTSNFYSSVKQGNKVEKNYWGVEITLPERIYRYLTGHY